MRLLGWAVQGSKPATLGTIARSSRVPRRLTASRDLAVAEQKRGKVNDDLVEQPELEALLGEIGAEDADVPAPAACPARASAASMSSSMNVPVIQPGTTAGGSWVRTKYGPVQAPP
jgi:hypothetical protein